jgi:hypothetical protein
VPIPEEEGHGESGMRVGPRRIEIHVDGKRAAPPDGDGGEESPAVGDILAREAKGKKETKEAVEAGGESHGEAVRSGEAVSWNGGAENAGYADGEMGEEKKRSPEKGRTHCEMIVEVTGGGAKNSARLTVFVDPGVTEARVCKLIVAGEIEGVLDERGADEGIVADTVAVDPRVQQGQRKEKKDEERAIGRTRWPGLIERVRQEKSVKPTISHAG